MTANREGEIEGGSRGVPETLFRTIADRLPAITYLTTGSPEGAPLYVSPRMADVLGYPAAEWADPALWRDCLHPDDRERVLAERRRTSATGEPFDAEYRMLARDGRVVWIHDEATAVPGPDGRPAFRVGVLHDVTEHREAERRASDAQEMYRVLVEQIPAITYTDAVDDEMSTVYISPQVETLLGVAPHEWVADPGLWYRRLHPEDRERALATYLRGRAEGRSFAYEYRMIAGDGRVVWFRDDAVVLRGERDEPRLVHGVMLDITERKQAEEQASFLAYHDKLTGLPNRAMFEELLDLSLARARRHGLSVAVLSVDLDDFKLVNEGLGHEAGDELLRQVAARLAEATRETDLVARQGSDEFLLLLSDLEARTPAAGTVDGPQVVAESVAGRVRELLAPPFDLEGTEVFATASMGVALFPSTAVDGRSLLKNAGVAMHRSKAAGPGGCVVFSHGDGASVGRLSLATRLRRAVEREHWVLHYQPIVDLTGGEVLEVEALVRWRDPGGGLIAPGEFIPLAEEMGLIEAIGDWVLGEACRQARSWDRLGLGLGIGFNLSPRQLWQPDVARRILERLDAEGVDPTSMVVEVTESTVMTDPDRAQRVLGELSAHGLRIAIDDFGTGYSSLARLRDMPVDVLKVDRSFIRDIPGDSGACSMVRAVVQLAQTLGVTPLAEGIETEEQRRFLVDGGCDLGQGYLFSRPVCAAEVASLAAEPGARAAGAAG